MIADITAKMGEGHGYGERKEEKRKKEKKKESGRAAMGFGDVGEQWVRQKDIRILSCAADCPVISNNPRR